MEGTLLVDEMLDGLLPGEFDEWLAYREIEPDQLDRIITILKLGFSALCNAWDLKLEPKDFDPHMQDHPDQPHTTDGQEVSPNQGVAMLTTVLGAPD